MRNALFLPKREKLTKNEGEKTEEVFMLTPPVLIGKIPILKQPVFSIEKKQESRLVTVKVWPEK
jgi:hypothetical protein